MPATTNHLNKVMDYLFGSCNATYAAPTTYYVALLLNGATIDANGAIGGNGEVSATSTNYARVAVTNNKVNFTLADGGILKNGANIVFPTADANWSEGETKRIKYVAIGNAATRGTNVLYYAELTPQREVLQGTTVYFAPNDITFTMTTSV
ncbi:MAG TPA: hypothetical protein PLT28_00370 [Saprospiraceae bacterium]|nr:hypothetical protein [Saprospiraceae bacterium]